MTGGCYPLLINALKSPEMSAGKRISPALGSTTYAVVLFAIPLLIAFSLACVQGYWRHDSWIYTDSELHEIVDGRWLAQPLHFVLRKIPPELSIVIALAIVSSFLYLELQRIYGNNKLSAMSAAILSLGLLSPSVLSQLHWPTHTLAAALVLIPSLPLRNKEGFGYRLLRSFIICFGSLSILSSFSFFAPLCLLPGRGGLCAQASKTDLLGWCESFAVAVVTPLVMAGSLVLVGVIKRMYCLLGNSFALGPGRLESFNINSSVYTGLDVLRELYIFLPRQWGFLGFAMPVLVVCAIVLVLARQSSASLAMIFVAIWILLAPMLAAVASGTGWQRVAFAWCVVPSLLALISAGIRLPWLRMAVLLFLLSACVSSAVIGIQNFAQAAVATRSINSQVSMVLQDPSLHLKLLIVEVDDIDSLSPRFAWGGWPPFAASNPRNVRFHRVFDELGIRNYVIKYDLGFFPTDFSDFIGSCMYLDGPMLPSSLVLSCYNEKMGTSLQGFISLRLRPGA